MSQSHAHEGFVERPVPRPASSRSTCQFDRQPIEAVKVSAVLVDATPELVDSPVPTSLAGADDVTNCMSPLTQQAVLEGDLSMKEEVVAELDFCDSVVRGPTSAFLSNTDGIVVVSYPADLNGDVTISVSSRPTLLETSLSVCRPRPTLQEVSPSEWHPMAVAEVASSADLAGDVTVGVASSASSSPCDITEVASSADLVKVASSADLAEVEWFGVIMMTIFMMDSMMRARTMMIRVILVILMCMALLNRMIVS